MQEGALARVVEETIVDRLRGQHRAQRQEAAGQALGQAQQVGLDAGLFASEHRAGAAEADRDLVGDQEHAVHVAQFAHALEVHRSEEHTSELQSLMRISYAVFCLKKKTNQTNNYLLS